MDGLGADANVTFLLTASQADVLEDALAARPGRIDHTARLPLPDAAARRRLVRLYQGGLHIGRTSAVTVVARTDGVTASFIRELLRRAALHAAMHADGARGGPHHAGRRRGPAGQRRRAASRPGGQRRGHQPRTCHCG